MRLTCPNCDAQYEVPDEVIPPEGRDVQCSNCGDTWYQTGANAAAAAALDVSPEAAPAQSDLAAEQPAEHLAEQLTGQTIRQADAKQAQQDAANDEDTQPQPAAAAPLADPTPAPEPDVAAAPEAEIDMEPAAEDDPDEVPVEAPVEAPAHTGLARGMDPSVTGILREEAKREAQLRAAEGTGLESQPDLGLDAEPEDEVSRRAHQARDRMARLKGENPALLAAAESGSRRGLLPDIEEINSTLRASGAPAGAASIAPEAGHPPRRKSGFSRGFALVILLMLALVLTYTNAPQIANTLPQADPYLSSYVASVDKARLWLDAKVSGLQPSQ
ncbi:zinc-ribbon domain-containing protein [Parasedimentitalea psychrophila]|uniref:Zinc-ribbon domain-containing protein n=1 Tax=Parasedimentitalea psychrophila TaxID=2997337 RepID=A0A9Y2L1D4_9RHOB|nr:zinc-ribbon domain-containing protein [Parasedimentitalea psychrophila]WIY26244.1 zinc-ribbon domain-containing protein [Parasedimentitalea psychrophila]